jgi:hypothetical protein
VLYGCPYGGEKPNASQLKSEYFLNSFISVEYKTTQDGHLESAFKCHPGGDK